ncbi:hypothetical protein BAE44_0020077 [Dichanthelium oligosanthes]|uniref:Uncharacterized protein n=1 Tax=Dichanthelium oligosanthes TaxID=888268 RepID=A0A1E5V1H6_9POAL|nr:hypothetical protein BAE44_0020077 [Dichanthelium oligosanthes]
MNEMEIGNTIIKSGTRPGPRTTVPTVRTLALSLHFTICSEVEMLPSFLKCFPNVVKSIPPLAVIACHRCCIIIHCMAKMCSNFISQSEVNHEPTGNLNPKFWQETGAINCVQWHVKTLVLREFQGEPNELDFLMYVADNVRVLENMVLVLKLGRYSAPEEVANKFMALDSARWASGGSKLKSLWSRLRDGGSVWNLKAGCDLTFSDPFSAFKVINGRICLELVLGAIALEDRDLEFLLAASPVLEILAIVGSVQKLNACLSSHSLRCAQFCLVIIEEVAVVDAPSLQRLFIWQCLNQRRGGRVKIGQAPRLSMLGYLEPGVHMLEIGNTIIKSGTKPSPKTTVPSDVSAAPAFQSMQ